MIDPASIGLLLILSKSANVVYEIPNPSHYSVEYVLPATTAANTPTGTFFVDPARVYEHHWSKEFNEQMNWVMFFGDPKRGFAIHEDPGHPSHGCIHIGRSKAKELWWNVYTTLALGYRVEVEIAP